MTEETRTEEIGLERHAPRLAGHGPPPGAAGSHGKKKTSRLSILALVIALAALLLAVQARLDSQKDVVAAMNRMLTDTVLPEVKKSRNRDLMGHIYDLKRVMITLEEVRESTSSEEVKMRIDQIRNEIEELTIKVFVHE